MTLTPEYGDFQAFAEADDPFDGDRDHEAPTISGLGGIVGFGRMVPPLAALCFSPPQILAQSLGAALLARRWRRWSRLAVAIGSRVDWFIEAVGQNFAPS